MEPKFKIEGRIAKPLAEVYEAVADPRILSRYFTTGGAKGRMERGSTLTWDFADFPGPFDVRVKSAIRNSLIILEWAEGGYSTQVEFHFEGIEGDRTRVSIEESGWHETDASFKASYKNCEGWTQMLCCMKAWLEYGVVLRTGFYK
jgi:uncharacterized protein YndB with AHSA1/START domain